MYKTCLCLFAAVIEHTISFKTTNLHFAFQTNDLVVIFVDGKARVQMFVILQTSLSCVTRRDVSNIDVPSSHVQEEETQFVVVLL